MDDMNNVNELQNRIMIESILAKLELIQMTRDRMKKIQKLNDIIDKSYDVLIRRLEEEMQSDFQNINTNLLVSIIDKFNVIQNSLISGILSATKSQSGKSNNDVVESYNSLYEAQEIMLDKKEYNLVNKLVEFVNKVRSDKNIEQ